MLSAVASIESSAEVGNASTHCRSGGRSPSITELNLFPTKLVLHPLPPRRDSISIKYPIMSQCQSYSEAQIEDYSSKLEEQIFDAITINIPSNYEQTKCAF